MPAVEVGVGEVILGGDGVLMERAVVRMVQRQSLQALELGDRAMADDLDLRLRGDGSEVPMEDAALVDSRCSMAVDAGVGIEPPRQLELCFRRQPLLALDQDHLVCVDGLSERLEAGVYRRY